MIKSYDVPLLVLTAATGAVDGVSYLALDKVFTGNMTGNVLFLGFAVAGDGQKITNNLVALLAFMLGAVLGSRLTRGAGDGPKLPLSSMRVLIGGTALTLVLAALWFVVGEHLSDTEVVVLTGLLSIVLGAQASAVKHVGIRDLSTVVVTMTMVNLSADSRVAGGKGADWLRRVGAIVTMGVGALLSGLLVLHVGKQTGLLLAGGLMIIGVALCGVVRRHELAATVG